MSENIEKCDLSEETYSDASETDIKWMNEALILAKAASKAGEVPVGAIIVKDDIILGKGRNQVEEFSDPTAHAEMLAIREALTTYGGFRLKGCSLYVTLEPCSMCAGALVHCRIDRVIIGTADPKTGACGSVLNITEHPSLNHHPVVKTGILQEECSTALRDFFKERRILREDRHILP